MRIQINLSDEILERVEQEAKRVGTSKGAMLSTWIADKINDIDLTKAILVNFSKNKDFKDVYDLYIQMMKDKEENGK